MEEKKKCIFFLATLRNCDKYLSIIFKNIDQLRKYHHVFCIFVYDNCNDQTANKLFEYQQLHGSSYPSVVHVEELQGNDSKLRTVRIANGRNRCLEILETHEKYLDCDFHIMLDMDDVNAKPWNIDRINQYLDNFDQDDWDTISFNRDPYYDIWALMIDDYDHHVWGFGEHSRLLVQYMKKYMKIKLNICPETVNSVSCRSAFNGFAIYKSHRFQDIRYDGTYSGFLKENLVNDKQRQECLEKYKFYLKNRHLRMEQCSFPFLHADEHCEHLFYHNMAIQKKECKIKISKFSIFL